MGRAGLELLGLFGPGLLLGGLYMFRALRKGGAITRDRVPSVESHGIVVEIDLSVRLAEMDLVVFDSMPL